MLTVILGFATSLVYGFADFFGAIASRKIKAVTVTFVAGLSGLSFLLTLSIFMGADFSQEAIFWGVLAGVASAAAMSALYASLAIGPISILSPLSAVVSAVVPMLVGFAQGDRFSIWGLLALAAILVAIFLVGFVPGDDVRLPSAKGLILGTAAGVGIGIVLICLDQAPVNSGLSSVILLRAVAATLLGTFTLFMFLKSRRVNTQEARPQRAPFKLWIAVVLAGLFDSSANVFFLLASRIGSLSVVSVLTALYPLGTIILARIFLKEKIAKTQMFGILIALGASAVLALG
jgi:drug/metabolite transporter (DMT)-like permease